MSDRECIVPECHRPAYDRRECSTHARRRATTGGYGPQISVQRPRGLTAWQCVEWYGWEVTEAGCWEFSGVRTDDGYGSFYFERSAHSAHRTSFEQHHGPLAGRHVRHTCDNPPCINPAHLVAGTNADNMADKVERGRQARGERNGKAKLNEAQVADIKARASERTTDLAREFGVGFTAIKKIRTGQSWGWVAPARDAR